MPGVDTDVRGPSRRTVARALAPAPAGAVAVAVVALAGRLLPELRGGGPTGLIGYDDGVYFGAADALLSGRLPYRDVVLLHPPGIVVVLLPFAALGRLLGDAAGLGTARVAFMVVGTFSALLVAKVGGRRSPLAGLAAGLTYAVWRPASGTEGAAVLEPLVSLGLLASLLLLGDGRPTRRRLAAAGVALGLAVAVKAWAVVPFVVVAAWVWRRAGRRAAARYVASGTLAAAMVCLPFLLAAGPPMLRMVVLDQLGRTRTGIGPVPRLASMLAVHPDIGPLPRADVTATWALALAGAVGVGLLAWRRPETRLWAALLAATGSTLLLSPSYFAHYSAFAAPPVALLAGAGVAAAAEGSAARVLRPAVAVAGPAVLALLAAQVVSHPEGRPVPAAATARALAAARCVTADSTAALVASDVLTRDLRRGCPVVVDVVGLPYDQDRGDLPQGATTAARRRDAEWQREVDRYLARGDAVLLERLGGDGLDPWVVSGLERRYRVGGSPAYRVLVR